MKRKPQTKTKTRPKVWVVEVWTALTPEWLSVATYKQLPAAVRHCTRAVKVAESTSQPGRRMSTLGYLANAVETITGRDFGLPPSRRSWGRILAQVRADGGYHFRIRNTKTKEIIPAEGLGL